MVFTKLGSSRPKTVIRLAASILKSADDLVGEENCFALFVPSKDPYYFRAVSSQQKASWLSSLSQYCATTEWSTSSMVTAFVDAVVVASQDGVIIEVNDKTLDLFGYSRSEVVGKNVKILMPASVAAVHDKYIENYIRSGVTKLIGKPRSLIGKHKDGSDLRLIISLGVESSDQKKTFIATLRLDKENASMPSQVELDAILKKSVDATMEEANRKIKETLGQELEVIMKRLEGQISVLFCFFFFFPNSFLLQNISRKVVFKLPKH
jgi:PAS domain S-box-containing protein